MFVTDSLKATMENQCEFNGYRSGSDRRLECDRCGQRHMRNAEMILASGTRSGLSRGPRYTVHHTSQTNLVLRLSAIKPAPNFKFKLFVASIFMVVFASATFVDMWVEATFPNLYEPLPYFLVPLLGIYCGGSCGGFAYYFLIKRVFPRLYRYLVHGSASELESASRFRNTWVCMACGHSQVHKPTYL